MSVKIRLKRMGSKKKPFYRLIATDSRMPRDGRFLETLGYYNPMTEPPDIKIHEDIVFKWFDRGATPSENAASLLRRVGCIQKYDLIKSGVTGEELEVKVEAIRNQQETAAAKKRAKKEGAKSAKAAAKESAETAEEPKEAPKAAEESKDAPKAAEPAAAEGKEPETPETEEPAAEAAPPEEPETK